MSRKRKNKSRSSKGFVPAERDLPLEEAQAPSPSFSEEKSKKKPKKRPPEPGTFPGSSSNVGQPNDPRDLSAVLAYGPSYLPYTAAWTDSRTEQVRAFRRWIYVAIDKIASSMAAQHPNISYLLAGDPEDYRSKLQPEPLLRSYKSAFPHLPASYLERCPQVTKLRHLQRLHQRTRALTPLLSHESLKPLEYNHPLRRLLADPNDPDTSWTLWYETVMFYLLTGNAYWWTPLHPQTGLPEAIWVIPSHWMWPMVGKDRLIEGWEIRPVEGNYLRQVLPANEVIHFKHPNPISKIDGMGPLTAISQWADVSESIDRSRTMAFRNGMLQTIAIQFDGSLNDPSDEMLRRIEAKIISRYIGENRSNKPLYLPPGVKATPLSIKPNEMVWGESAMETRDNILGAFHVPPGIVALSPTNPEDRATFCGEALNPLASFLGQVVSEKLCPLYDKGKRGLRLWYEDFVPNDPEHLEETIKTDLMCGAITPNEVRILRGREPYPEDWADRPVLPVNMAPLTLPAGGPHQDPNTLLPPNLPEQPRTNNE